VLDVSCIDLISPFNYILGCGAACIYSLLGARKNGWRFTATETDATNFEYATRNIAKNNITDLISGRILSGSSLKLTNWAGLLIQPDITDSDLLEILHSCFVPWKKNVTKFFSRSSGHWNTDRQSLTKFAHPVPSAAHISGPMVPRKITLIPLEIYLKVLFDHPIKWTVTLNYWRNKHKKVNKKKRVFFVICQNCSIMSFMCQ